MTVGNPSADGDPCRGAAAVTLSPLAQRITDLLPLAPRQYYRLILAVGPAGAGKTQALQALSAQHGFPYLDVNLELGRRLLHLTGRDRALRAPQELAALIPPGSNTTLLDNLELLFDPALQLDPLVALQRLSRNTTIVATWNGAISDGKLRYAAPGHPEYRQYQLVDVLIAQAEL